MEIITAKPKEQTAEELESLLLRKTNEDLQSKIDALKVEISKLRTDHELTLESKIEEGVKQKLAQHDAEAEAARQYELEKRRPHVPKPSTFEAFSEMSVAEKSACIRVFGLDFVNQLAKKFTRQQTQLAERRRLGLLR